MFLNEVKVQREAAKDGFVVDIDDFEIADYERRVYGREPPGKTRFLITVMPRMSYSLKDKQQQCMCFDSESI